MMASILARCLIFGVIIIPCVAASVDSISEEYSDIRTVEGMKFYYDQMVDGHGLASESENFISGPVETNSFTHGSGYLKKDISLEVEENIKYNNRSGEYVLSGLRRISADRSYDMVFSESNLKIPGSFKSGSFRSLWKESDVVHQRNLAMIAGSTIDNAKLINKNLSTEVVGSLKIDSYIPDYSEFDASMKSNLDLNIDGRVNTFFIQGPPFFKGINTSNQNTIDLEEMHIGQIRMNQKIELDLDSQTRSEKYDPDDLTCICNESDSYYLPYLNYITFGAEDPFAKLNSSNNFKV